MPIFHHDATVVAPFGSVAVILASDVFQVHLRGAYVRSTFCPSSAFDLILAGRDVFADPHASGSLLLVQGLLAYDRSRSLCHCPGNSTEFRLDPLCLLSRGVQAIELAMQLD